MTGILYHVDTPAPLPYNKAGRLAEEPSMPIYSRRLYQQATLYEQPNTESAVLGVLPPGMNVQVLDLQKTWLLVEDPRPGGRQGYIAYRAIQPPRRTTPDNRPADLEGEASSVPSGPPAAEIRTALKQEEEQSPTDKPPAPPPGTPEAAALEPAKKLTETATPVEKVVAQTWNRYGGLLSALAQQYGLDPAILAAVVSVESGGAAFGPQNRMIIRFENHLFYDYWGKQNKTVYDQHFKFNSTKRWKDHLYRPTATGEWQTFHGDQLKEWAVLEFASGFGTAAARMSISMGAPQILGSNFKRVGFKTVNEMFKAFNDRENGERWQLVAMFKFIENDPYNRGLLSLRNEDYVAFATMYNGAGQAQTYANLIGERTLVLRRLLSQ
ncbi:MAG: DUF3380 domain-containing protein [Chloroflexi bacterium]|nr:DUF3380 domain-containing protein [Chloroflexota bacterium]